jgi:hypothetical protein
MSSKRSGGRAQCLKFVRRQSAGSLAAFYLLKSDQSMSRSWVQIAVNRSSPISQIRQTLLAFESLLEAYLLV